MKSSAVKLCYACHQPATTKEHAPPESFFPVGLRTNLITVPSCELHNNANSLDVEYARNIITVSNGVNKVGDQHFAGKGIRSLEHSPALLQTSFSDIRPVNLDGQTVGAFTLDTERIDSVMKAILTALHFRETGEKVSTWGIVRPSRGFSNHNTTTAEVEEWCQMLSMLDQISYEPRKTGTPEVFRYAVSDLQDGWVYQLVFYDGYFIFGLAPKRKTIA